MNKSKQRRMASLNGEKKYEQEKFCRVVCAAQENYHAKEITRSTFLLRPISCKLAVVDRLGATYTPPSALK